jgi:hypothetical protein
MIITIHQPEHAPWLGFFHKINLADTYLVLDNVQYRRRYFQNRNKIRTKDGWQWIIVPLEKESRDELLIKDARIANEGKWKKDNLQSISQNYSKAPFFNEWWDVFSTVYSKDYTFLIDLNMSILKACFTYLGMTKKIVFASDLKAEGSKGDLIFSLSKAAQAEKYISGVSGKEYLDLEKFRVQGIAVDFQEFHHPIYRQLHEPFLPCLSIIDLLFNYGPKSLSIINGVGVPVMEEIFL